MELILIRHGIAEDKQDQQEDIERHLTEEGKEKFRKFVPELTAKLEPLDERAVVLWSSPAMRALETAQIVAEELEVETNAIQDFIYEGGFEELSEAVKNVEADTTLLLVGHEPLLSQWTKEMTGEEIKIRKGDMLNFKVTNQSPLEAKLEWHTSPKK